MKLRGCLPPLRAQGVWTGMTNLVAVTSNAPPDLLTEFYRVHYTG
jgi:hypothetical protein